MRNRTTAIGALLGTAVGLAWGGQFVVGKSALGTINAFPLSTIRYSSRRSSGWACSRSIEGRRWLLQAGHGLRLFWLGSLGFGGFNLLGFTGLAHARPGSAPHWIVALAPLLTALVLWRRTRRAPRDGDDGTFLIGCRARRRRAGDQRAGHPSRHLPAARSAGATCSCSAACSASCSTGWARQACPGFSPLRYTALTAGLGWFTLAGATLVAIGAGLVDMPSAGQLTVGRPADRLPRDPGRLRGRPRLERGDQAPRRRRTPSLFGNLIPVTTFAIEIVRGYRPGAAALAGAVVTVAALVANNLVGRSTTVWRWPLTQAPNGSRGSGGTSGAVSALPWSFSRSSSSCRE